MKITIEMNLYELNRTITAGTLPALTMDLISLENETRSVPVEAAQQNKKVVSTPAAETVKEAAAAVETTEGEKEPEIKISEVEIRAKFVELSKKGKKAELKTLLTKMGVEKVSDLTPEQYNEAWEGLEAI